MEEKQFLSVDEHFESLAQELNLHCKGGSCRGKEWKKHHFFLVRDWDLFPEKIFRYKLLSKGDPCNSCRKIINLKREELRILFKKKY